MLERLISENLTILNQGIEILDRISAEVYTATNTETFGSSCGGHFRHLIQHYQSFLDGVRDGFVDYDHRDRTVDFELDRAAAVQVLHEIRDAFETLAFDEKPLKILQNYDPQIPKQPAVSGVARELTFLVSHSIHHYALIGIILRLNFIEVPQHFGFAPSTIYYLQGLAKENETSMLVNAQ